MRYALHRGEGFLLITGKPGTGKTTLVKELLGELEMTRFKVSTLVSTQLEADDLLRSVAYAYDLPVESTNKATIIQYLRNYLIRRNHNRLRTILIVDEAQDLPSSALEELRLLTNLEQDNKPLLQVFLVGQPRLNELLGASSMEQLRQRITVATAMQPLSADEVEAYIQHRLTVAGWIHDPEIDKEVYGFIHEYSRGIPRQINLVCSRLLLHGYVEEKHSLDLDDMTAVVNDLAEEQLAMSHCRPVKKPEMDVKELTKDPVVTSIVHLH